MGKNKYVFKRNELKYKLNAKEYSLLLEEIEKHLNIDEYGETTIQSLYYDTESWLLIRNSIERPFYKEKIRVRSYGLATPEKQVFLELKKKCDKVVFKRRIGIKQKDVHDFIKLGIGSDKGQIEKEISYFCKFYGDINPKMLLLYDRTSFVESGGGLRITFDRNIRYRTDRLNLCSGLDGKPILDEGEVMMEVKTEGAYPMWLVKLLNENHIYKTSFSKYGKAYVLEQSSNKKINDSYIEERAV